MTRRAALVCLLLGMAGAAVFVLVSSPSNVVKIPGSGDLVLVGVTHGTLNQFPDRGWKNGLLRFLPNVIARRFPTRGATISTPNTNLVIWFERFGGEMPRVILRDSHGIEFGQNSCAFSAGEAWQGVGFNVVPRRDKEFFVRLYSVTNHDDPGALLGEFKVQNPLWGNFPTWTPEFLPAIRQTNGLTLTLRELSAGVRWSVPMERAPAVHPADVGVRVAFDFAENGLPTDAWTVVGIETSDATGNQFQHREWMSDVRDIKDCRLILHYRWGLWPTESAWKLKVQVARRAGFTADELWTVRGFHLNRTETNGSVAAQTNLQGAVVQLESRMLENAVLGRKTLQLKVAPHREDYRFDVVRVTDDKGRSVPMTGESGSGGRHTFDLKPDADAKSLDLTFALHQTRFVEFMAKPIWLGTADDARKVSADLPR